MAAGNYLNDLSGLMPTFFFAVQVIQNEPTALTQACTVNTEVAQVAQGMTATYDISPPAGAPQTIVPGALPVIVGETAGKGTLVLTNAQSLFFEYTGEEQRQLMIAGIYQNKYLNQIKQRIRSIRNAIELNLANTYTQASRVCGTPGSAPFTFAFQTTPPATSGMEAFGLLQKEMLDTGSPENERQLCVNSTNAQRISNLPNLFKVSEAGSENLLRTGQLGTIKGFACRPSGQIPTIPVTSLGGNARNYAGTGYSATTAIAAGATTIPLSGGNGTIIAGDIISFGSADASRQYMVGSALTAGALTINLPGLMTAIPQGTACSVNHYAYTPNMAFTRDAITLVARQPLLPGFGQAAGGAPGAGGAGGILLDAQLLPDPATGLVYQIAMWSMYRMIAIEIAITYGWAVTNPQDLFVLASD